MVDVLDGVVSLDRGRLTTDNKDLLLVGSSSDFSFLRRGSVAYFSMVLVSIVLSLGASKMARKERDISGAGLLLMEGHRPSSVGVGVLVALAEEGRLESGFGRSRELGTGFLGALPCTRSSDFSLAGGSWRRGFWGGLDLDRSFIVDFFESCKLTFFLELPELTRLEFLEEELPATEELSEPFSLVRSPFLKV